MECVDNYDLPALATYAAIPVQRLLDWFPGMGFKTVAAKFRETNKRQVSVPVCFVKEQIVRSFSIRVCRLSFLLYQADGHALPCFATNILNSNPSEPELEAFPYVTTALYGGGQDTVGSYPICGVNSRF